MKKFSQLAIPYIVWAVIMLVLPMALIDRVLFRDKTRQQHFFILSHTGTLRHIFYRP